MPVPFEKLPGLHQGAKAMMLGYILPHIHAELYQLNEKQRLHMLQEIRMELLYWETLSTQQIADRLKARNGL